MVLYTSNFPVWKFLKLHFKRASICGSTDCAFSVGLNNYVKQQKSFQHTVHIFDDILSLLAVNSNRATAAQLCTL